MEYMNKIKEAATYIRARFGIIPPVAMVLGSGLGLLADKMTDKKEIAYGSIPNFPVSTVVGHEGKLIKGELSGRSVIALCGRFHYYEGYEMADITMYVKVLMLLGVKTLIITNAAGGVNKAFNAGDLMLITDHIKFFDASPLRGKNYEDLGPRFNDMSFAYTPELQRIAKEAAKSANIELKEGVYAFMPGPSFETPAEIRMLSVLGADAVGMSTVPEVISAAHSSMEVLGISCITNMAAGILAQPLSHEEVFETAEKTKDRFSALIEAIVVLVSR